MEIAISLFFSCSICVPLSVSNLPSPSLAMFYGLFSLQLIFRIINSFPVACSVDQSESIIYGANLYSSPQGLGSWSRMIQTFWSDPDLVLFEKFCLIQIWHNSVCWRGIWIWLASGAGMALGILVGSVFGIIQNILSDPDLEWSWYFGRIRIWPDPGILIG